ncbi:MAG: toll/interleukin-1 receptor domain-containing protein [Anaerolineae bacterium]|nr:toll/interleukin-1 receptor domain-containing protein [Anaerolineae bacterium]
MQHLYISYPPNEYEFAHRLVDNLQALGYPVFVDAVSETGTPPWAAETHRAIRTCGAVILILGLAERRPTGIRHEGVSANRQEKPVFVAIRSPGDLPRYLAHATSIDFSGDYDSAFQELVAHLPSAPALLTAPSLPWQRHPRRRAAPPRSPGHYRRIVWWLAVAAMIIACITIGIVVGAIPV